MVPILDQTMTNGLVDLVGFGIGVGFVTDEEVKVLDTAFGSEGGC